MAFGIPAAASQPFGGIGHSTVGGVPLNSQAGQNFVSGIQAGNIANLGAAANAQVQAQGNWYDYDLGLRGLIDAFNINRDNLYQAYNIAELQDLGQTERTGLETRSAEEIAREQARAQMYGFDRTLEGQLGTANIGADTRRYEADIQQAINDMSTARALEGTQYASDAQTEQAEIGTRPALEQIAFAERRFDQVLPWVQDLTDRALAGRPGAPGGGGGGTGVNIPAIQAPDVAATENYLNQGADKAFAAQHLGDVSGLGGRGFTASGSGESLRQRENQRRLGLQNAYAGNYQKAHEIAQGYLPARLQAANTQLNRHLGEQNIRQRDEEIANNYLLGILGIGVGGLA